MRLIRCRILIHKKSLLHTRERIGGKDETWYCVPPPHILFLPLSPSQTDGPTEEVQLFTRSQTSIADCLLKQRDYSGLTCDRLNRLLQYLQVSMSATRMPSADILSRLWHITSDLKVSTQI